MSDTPNTPVVIFAPSGRSDHHHHHNVVEKRAPTDESVALLREMEKAAREQVERAIRLQINEFECLAQSYHDDASGDVVIMVRFMLAGSRMKVEHRHRMFDPLDDLGSVVIDKMARAIAETAIAPLVVQMDRAGLVRK